MRSEKKSKPDSLYILILILVILAVSVWIVKIKFDELNDNINTIAANEERLRNENEILSVQLEKCRFIADAAAQNILVNNSIRGEN